MNKTIITSTAITLVSLLMGGVVIPVFAEVMEHSTSGKSVDVSIDLRLTGNTERDSMSGKTLQEADIIINFYKPNSNDVQPNVEYGIVSYSLDPKSICPGTMDICRDRIPGMFGSASSTAVRIIDNGREMETINSNFSGKQQGIYVSQNEFTGQTFQKAASWETGDHVITIIVGSIGGKRISQETAEFKFNVSPGVISRIYGSTTSQPTKTENQPATSNQNEQKQTSGKEGGGCLIATASFGSAMAPQVQQLRETRDNIVMKTQSGTAFMTAFDSVYYSFAPTVADWERQNTIFKEVVKVAITPLITTLSILNYLNIDSEPEMLGYGIGIILLNVGMYFVAPAFVVIRLKQRKK